MCRSAVIEEAARAIGGLAVTLFLSALFVKAAMMLAERILG